MRLVQKLKGLFLVLRGLRLAVQLGETHFLPDFNTDCGNSDKSIKSFSVDAKISVPDFRIFHSTILPNCFAKINFEFNNFFMYIIIKKKKMFTQQQCKFYGMRQYIQYFILPLVSEICVTLIKLMSGLPCRD